MDTGRAYRRWAVELVTLLRFFIEISPETAECDALFKE